VTLPVVPKLRKNLSGLRFGRLLVLAFHSKVGNRIMYSCMCECGTEALVRGPDLTNGHSQSCGCLTKDKIREALTTHGRTGTAEHLIWKDRKGGASVPADKRSFAQDRDLAGPAGKQGRRGVQRRQAAGNDEDRQDRLVGVGGLASSGPPPSRAPTRSARASPRRRSSTSRCSWRLAGAWSWAVGSGLMHIITIERLSD
jgi:general stress protein YciG